jgi:glycosyltransferase involved in cell wall biosynthesis
MLEKKPRVSVGMPLYNGARFPEEALDSIFAQTFESKSFWACPFLRAV